jgi:hypothetical protein
MQDPLSPTQRDDRATQSGLLGLVLSNHPTILTGEELMRQMSAGSDAFERALWTLRGAGLLREEGESVMPTYAALTFDRLDA